MVKMIGMEIMRANVWKTTLNVKSKEGTIAGRFPEQMQLRLSVAHGPSYEIIEDNLRRLGEGGLCTTCG